MDYEELPTFEPIKTKAVKRKAIVKEPKKEKRPLESIEKAVWQYLLDHSTPTKNGLWVSFAVVNRDDFFRRVEARRLGIFKRVEEQKIQQQVIKAQTNMKWQEKRSQAYSRAQQEGEWWLKLAISLRKKLTKFIDKHTKS